MPGRSANYQLLAIAGLFHLYRSNVNKQRNISPTFRIYFPVIGIAIYVLTLCTLPYAFVLRMQQDLMMESIEQNVAVLNLIKSELQSAIMLNINISTIAKI
jgi:hypothetical protein